MSETDVNDEMRKADVFVLPSSNEGLPLVSLKAMVLSLLVIVTPVGAIGKVIDEAKNRILVDIGNVKQISEAIKKLAVDIPLRRNMAANSREYYAQHFTKEHVWPLLDQIYKRDI